MIKICYPVQSYISLNCAHMVGRCRAWHTIMVIGQHTQSDTSGVTCHLCPCIAKTMGQRRVWHAIIAFGLHTESYEV